MIDLFMSSFLWLSGPPLIPCHEDGGRRYLVSDAQVGRFAGLPMPTK
jgi:hypothetical protein